MKPQPTYSPVGMLVVAALCLPAGIGVVLTYDMSDVGRRGLPMPVVGWGLVAVAVFFAAYAVVVHRRKA